MYPIPRLMAGDVIFVDGGSPLIDPACSGGEGGAVPSVTLKKIPETY